jgi:hypothetical protein
MYVQSHLHLALNKFTIFMKSLNDYKYIDFAFIKIFKSSFSKIILSFSFSKNQLKYCDHFLFVKFQQHYITFNINEQCNIKYE